MCSDKWHLFRSRLGLLNFVIMQWFFVRIFYYTNGIGTNLGYGLMGFVLPLTGWWGDYIDVGKRWKFDIGRGSDAD